MICKKCGAGLPENATFCGKCGTPVTKKSTSSAALIKAHREVKKYKITSIVLAVLCLVMGIGWSVAAHDPVKSAESYEQEAASMERAGVELSGTFVVGEDEELPAGRYNIYPPDGESYLSVDVYNNMEDAKAKYDKDYKSLAVDQIYRTMRGYKLKAGQIVVIDYDSAYFELVSENAQDASEESADTDQNSESLQESQDGEQPAETE